MNYNNSNEIREESRKSGWSAAFLTGGRKRSTGTEAASADIAGAQKHHAGDNESDSITKCKCCETKIPAGQPVHKCCNCGGNVCDACKNDDFNTCEGCEGIYCNATWSKPNCTCAKCQLCGLIKCRKTCLVISKKVDRCAEAEACLDEDEIESGGWDKL